MKKITCPHCRKEHEYNIENQFRPFCSKRCKLIDLGAWADESYRVPLNSDQNISNEIQNEELTDDENYKSHDDRHSEEDLH